MQEDLVEWLERTAPDLQRLIDIGKDRDHSLDFIIQAESDSANLLIDGELFLTQAQAQAVLSIRDKYPDLTSRERGVMERAEVAKLQRVVDGLQVVARTLASRRFATMNANRSAR